MEAAQRRANVASPIKRQRATKGEVVNRCSALLGIVAAMKPITVRRVFHQASARGIIEKQQSGFTKVQAA
jgi:hypothetical protein